RLPLPRESRSASEMRPEAAHPFLQRRVGPGQSRAGPGGRGWLLKNAATSQAPCVEMGAAPSSTPKGILACTKALTVVSRFIPAAELNEPSLHTGGTSYPSRGCALRRRPCPSSPWHLTHCAA